MSARTRVRDLHYVLKGDVTPVRASPGMLSSGWTAGQGLQWFDSDSDVFSVEVSTGHFGGFTLYGSSDSYDEYTSIFGAQPRYGFTLLCTGTWVIELRTFERYTYASRQAGPLVALSYVVGDKLLFGLTGKFTKEDEWQASGDPRGSNPFFAGVVVQAVNSDGYLLVQTAT